MFGPKEEKPTIHALKEKSNAMKVSELNQKKIADFNEEQAEIISARIKSKNHYPIW
jgi:glutamyl-tRNA reductase